MVNMMIVKKIKFKKIHIIEVEKSIIIFIIIAVEFFLTIIILIATIATFWRYSYLLLHLINP